MKLPPEPCHVIDLPADPPGWCLWCGENTTPTRYGLESFFCKEACRVSYLWDCEECYDWPPLRDPTRAFKGV